MSICGAKFSKKSVFYSDCYYQIYEDYEIINYLYNCCVKKVEET